MGKSLETKITRFDGGIVNDPRNPAENVCRMVTNFDILTDPRRMIPYRDVELADDNGPTSKKKNFCVAYNGTSWKLFSLGVKSGATTAEVLSKALTLGGTADLGDNTWATPAANQSSSGATEFNLFVYYKKVGLIFGSRAGRYIWAFSPTGTAWDDSARDLTAYTNATQGLVHSKDDVLYIPYDNKIAKNDNGSWTSAAVTLPSHLYITSICEYGNYLAIATAPLSGVGDSVVYLWDRDSTLTTLAESINWGNGILKVLEELDGYLVGISLVGGQGTEYAKTDRVVFRYYGGGGSVNKIQEITVEPSTTTYLYQAKQKINNRLYFGMAIAINRAGRGGIWSIGRTSSGFTLVNERNVYNDESYTTLYNFYIVGDYVFTSFEAVSGVAVVKSNNTDSYTATSIYETKTFNLGDSDLTKKLLGATVMTEYLPAAGSVVLKYRIDQTGTWTTVFTNTTDNSISHGAINIESTGATLPQYKEIQFRIESTGGAIITGLKFKEEIISKELY